MFMLSLYITYKVSYRSVIQFGSVITNLILNRLITSDYDFFVTDNGDFITYGE